MGSAVHLSAALCSWVNASTVELSDSIAGRIESVLSVRSTEARRVSRSAESADDSAVYAAVIQRVFEGESVPDTLLTRAVSIPFDPLGGGLYGERDQAPAEMRQKLARALRDPGEPSEPDLGIASILLSRARSQRRVDAGLGATKILSFSPVVYSPARTEAPLLRGLVRRAQRLGSRGPADSIGRSLEHRRRIHALDNARLSVLGQTLPIPPVASSRYCGLVPVRR